MESSTLSTTSEPSNDELIQTLGNTCTYDYYCRQSVSQSRCYNGKCICMDGYISIDLQTCIEGNYCS
jgi:hypothetical protein